MTLPSSGLLTLGMIQGEFGGVNPVSMSEYYAGGANVPTGTSGVNGAVPTSGLIKISDFYGTSDATVFNLTAGTSENLRGFLRDTAGTLSPTTFRGGFVEVMMTNIISNIQTIGLEGTFPQDYFTSYAVGGGFTLLTADAVGFVQELGNTLWSWNDPFAYVDGQAYTVTVT